MNDKMGNYIKDLSEQGKENAEHIAKLNEELGVVKEHLASICTDIKWLKKLLFIGFGGIGTLITLIKLLGR